MTERGVSDVVGFVLVFSLVLSMVTVVYAFGFTGLEDARDAERLSNAERVFDILADNLADIHRRGAPSRATEIKLADATLGYGSETRVTVEITNVGSPVPTYSTSLDPIVYSPSDSNVQLVYENGAVVRERPSVGGVLLREPSSVFRKDGDVQTVVIPFFQTRQTGTASVGGSGTRRLRAEKAISEVLTARRNPTSANSDVDADPDDEYEVTYTVETTVARAPIWEEYLEERITWESNACSVSGDTVTCVFGVERLYVTATRVDVSFN